MKTMPLTKQLAIIMNRRRVSPFPRREEGPLLQAFSPARTSVLFCVLTLLTMASTRPLTRCQALSLSSSFKSPYRTIPTSRAASLSRTFSTRLFAETPQEPGSLHDPSLSGVYQSVVSPLQMIPCDHQQQSSSDQELEFKMSVGRALDTLQRDYPDLLTCDPDFSLYDPHVELVDPSGVKVHGITAYKNAFRLIHAIIKVFYCPSRSAITHVRMCYDQARRNIRVHWNAQAIPREIFGGSRTQLYLDGISVYEIDRETGNITQHRLEQLLINDAPVKAPEGVIAELSKHHGVVVPSYFTSAHSHHVLEFAPASLSRHSPGLMVAGSGGGTVPSPSSSLFAMEASGGETSANMEDEIDWEALETKNKSRKKFGLKPLTPEEFLELQAQVQQLDQQQRQQQAAAAAAAAEMKKSANRPDFLEKLFGNVLKNTCENNLDCERPEICCDFGFKKYCCSSGTPVVDGMQLRPALVPVPVDIGYPPNRGPGADY